MNSATTHRLVVSTILGMAVLALRAGSVESFPFGNFNSWVTRNIHESSVIGGHDKTLYEIGPTATINGNTPYHPHGGSPWATSNVYAKVHGITKGSNAVSPATRSGGDKCARLDSKIESIKVLGIVNMDVMVAGSIFLGRILEPISSTSGPYKKMDMGIPYTKRPRALSLDYRLELPKENMRVRATGFGAKKLLPGHDKAVAFVMLQRRWEDADGNIHARRVASGSRKFGNATPSWVNGQEIALVYGDPTGKPGYDASTLSLRDSKNNCYYAMNSKGRMVPVIEEGWDDPDATPTHAIVMISAASGEPFIGTPGLTLYVDNVGFAF